MCVCTKSLETTKIVLENEAAILIRWFEINLFKINAGKSHVIMTTTQRNLSVQVGEANISCTSEETLLGIIVDNKVTFDPHVKKLCCKATQNLHALIRISNYMSQGRKRLIMNAFINSQFSCCPLVWMFHNRNSNNTINKIHERALRTVYNDNESTFDELLRKDNIACVHHRNIQALATEIFKIKRGISPEIMIDILQERSIPYNFRNNANFVTYNVHTVKFGIESIRHLGPKIWNIMPNEIKELTDLLQFKQKIKFWIPSSCPCKLCKSNITVLGYLE